MRELARASGFVILGLATLYAASYIPQPNSAIGAEPTKVGPFSGYWTGGKGAKTYGSLYHDDRIKQTALCIGSADGSRLPFAITAEETGEVHFQVPVTKDGKTTVRRVPVSALLKLAE